MSAIQPTTRGCRGNRPGDAAAILTPGVHVHLYTVNINRHTYNPCITIFGRLRADKWVISAVIIGI